MICSWMVCILTLLLMSCTNSPLCDYRDSDHPRCKALYAGTAMQQNCAFLPLHIYSCITDTVEPHYNGHFGTRGSLVHEKFS